MPRPNFYLERAKPGIPAPITLHFKWGGIHFNKSTKEKVLPEHWNKRTHRVDERFFHLNNDYTEINRVLGELAMLVTNTYNKFRREGKLVELTKEVMDRYVTAYQLGKRTDGVLAEPVLDYYRRYIEERETDVTLTEATNKGDKQTFDKYEAFAGTAPAPIYFDNINLRLISRFRDWIFQNSRAKDNTINRHIKRFLQMCRHAAANGVEMGCDISSIKVATHLRLSTKAKDTIALYPDEIRELLKLDLTDKPHLERMRDIFVFYCGVGLRFNRWKVVSPDNFIERNGTYNLEIYTQKGQKEFLSIPLDPIPEQILLKYGMNLPEVPEKSEANRQIKEVCKLAGWTEPIQRRVQSRGKTEIETIPKWKAISPHTARRSFATNEWIAGRPIRDIMIQTGHSSEDTLMGYIKQDPRRAADRIAEDKRKKKS